MDVKQFISLGLVLLAVGVILLAYMRRRRRANSESEKRISRVRRRRFTDVPRERRSSLPRRNRDRPQGGMGNIVANEVDPLDEAEAYLTGGRDRDAESVLKDAIAKDPKRYELKLKLLAIYHQRHDASAFDPLAEELYAALGGRRDELWERLETMGRCLNPHNRVPRADSQSLGTASTESLQGTAFQSENRQRRHAALTAVAVAKAHLDMNDTQRALSFLDEALTHLSPYPASRVSSVAAKSWRKAAADNAGAGVATQENVSVREYEGVQRRKTSRRAIGNGRDATSWRPSEGDRRQPPGRRREDV